MFQSACEMAKIDSHENEEKSPQKSRDDEEEEDIMAQRKWYVTILLAFQHFLTMCAPNAMNSLILINSLCLANDSPMKSELISASFFVMGIATLLQTILGCRMPIIQGATYSILIPTLALMNTDELKSCNISENKFIQDRFRNMTKPESVFHMKMRLINGSFMAISLVEILLAASGSLYVIKKFISPLSLASIYTVLSLSICESLINLMSEQWAIGCLSMMVMTVLSIILAPKAIPIPIWNKSKGWYLEKIRIFQISPVLVSITVIWLICYVLTVTGALSRNPSGWGYGARTDTRLRVFHDSPIFKIPYPMQWGSPMVIPSFVIGMSAGIIISIIESIGDYIIIAETCKAPKIPQFAVNRGILMEGICVFLSGLLGSAVGPTSYSDNIGLIKITKVGNRLIPQVAAFIMIICGIFPIIGALFVSIPNPVIGGINFIITLMILACGISNLQYVNLTSSRNSVVYGFSIAFGIYLPYWSRKNSSLITIGHSSFDEVIQIILTNNIFIAATISIFLDSVLPGTCSTGTEIAITEHLEDEEKVQLTELDICYFYDLKILKALVVKCRFLQYIPLFPSYRKLEKVCKITSDNKENQISMC